MNLFQSLTHRRPSGGHALGPIVTPLCEGRCCRDRTVPLFVSLGRRGMLMLCADCRAWQQRIIRAALPELRRDR